MRWCGGDGGLVVHRGGGVAVVLVWWSGTNDLGTALDAASALIGCVECAPCDPVSGTEATSTQCNHRLGKVAVPIRPDAHAGVVP